MDVISDIKNFSLENEKPALLWLFSKYHLQSQWHFVAKVRHERYGYRSYETNRVWSPTEEGWILFRHAHELE